MQLMHAEYLVSLNGIQVYRREFPPCNFNVNISKFRSVLVRLIPAVENMLLA